MSSNTADGSTYAQELEDKDRTGYENTIYGAGYSLRSSTGSNSKAYFDELSAYSSESKESILRGLSQEHTSSKGSFAHFVDE